MTAPLRVGFIGAGEVSAEKHIPALRELSEIEIVAVADVDPARRAYVRRRFGLEHLYDDIAGILSHDGLNAVALCLPPNLQIQAACAALDAGKHVWIDPPTGLTLRDCDALIERAAKSDRTVIVGFHMRYHRLVRQARAIIDSGRLGNLHTFRAIWSSPRHRDRLKEWRRHRALGGGALGEPAIDHFDLWRYLMRSEIRVLFAAAMNDGWDDAAAVVSGQMENGVLVSAVLSERANHDVELEVCGDGGRLRVSLIRFEGLEYYSAGAMASGVGSRLGRMAHLLKELPRALRRMHKAGDYRLSYREQWRHFCQCIRSGTPVEVTLADGRHALAAMLAAMESAETRRLVTVSDYSSPR
jgi:predicted dehydrogenase